MAVKKVNDSSLTSVADAIRTKGGTSAQLYFPDGFIDAIEAIPTGGGGYDDLLDLLAGEASGDLVISGVTNTQRTQFQFSGTNNCNNNVTSLEFPDLEYAYINTGSLDAGFFSYPYSAPQIRSIRLPKCKMLMMHNTQKSDYANCFQNLTTLYTPELTVLDGCLRGSGLTSFAAPKLSNFIGSSNMFVNCTALEYADLGVITSGCLNFSGSTKLSALVFRAASVCPLSATSKLNNTLIASGTGYIYVPRDLINSYESATNWSTYAGQFRALEDYTADGTISGEFIMPT